MSFVSEIYIYFIIGIPYTCTLSKSAFKLDKKEEKHTYEDVKKDLKHNILQNSIEETASASGTKPPKLLVIYLSHIFLS